MADTVKTPWIKSLGNIPAEIQYFSGSMYDKLKLSAETYPNNKAVCFMHTTTTQARFLVKVNRCGYALYNLGIKRGDAVTIAMPNCPQAIEMFYALNMIGAIANMVHPLSSENELEFCINQSNSVAVLTLDQFYHKVEAIRNNTSIKHIIIASIRDELSAPIKVGYMLTEGRKVKKIPKDAPIIRWHKFMAMGLIPQNCKVDMKDDDPAVILYSGGTTGTTKGVVLTNRNFNALSQQIMAVNPMLAPGDLMLAAMPIFHGFGLGVGVHALITEGGGCVLVPRFNAKSYSKMIAKNKCNAMCGVPTLYEAMLRLSKMEKANLSNLKGIFCGGDTLSVELKKRFDKFLFEHNAKAPVREGYGTTESVASVCLTPPDNYREGSIGLPYPDTYFKIVEPGTENELPYGSEGEIAVSGPTVMKEYLNNPEETANVLKKHADCLTWLHTGDLGMMDEDGFIYFRGRIKRMIITSGYNVYPARLENILEMHPYVFRSCVIGVPDAYKMQKVKAFVTLKKGVLKTDETKQEILSYCRKNIAKYAMPYDIEFRDELPTTKVGKVAYRVLEEEEKQKLANQ